MNEHSALEVVPQKIVDMAPPTKEFLVTRMEQISARLKDVVLEQAEQPSELDAKIAEKPGCPLKGCITPGHAWSMRQL